MFVRPCFGVLMERMREPRQFIQVVVGPRQVGKSTLVKQALQQIDIPYTFELADGIPEDDTSWIGRVWESARAQYRIMGGGEYLLVIDEIQKIRNWSEAVKREWDLDSFNDVNIKVVLLGSSRLLLKSGLTESLAGRFEMIRLGHWSYQEMHDAFGWSVDQYIYYGGYPGGAHLVKNESRWKRYILDAVVEPAISKDVLMTTIIYKPALLRQLFELGCSYSGELLSLNKMLGQLQDAGNVTTLANYIKVLDECELLAGLQKYASDNSRKYNSIPKYQVYNSALMSVYTGRGFVKEYTDPMRWGRWVESAVGAYLVGKASVMDFKLYYWRDAQDEVDFVLARGESVIGIEVKSGRRTMNRGLSVFMEAFHSKYVYVVGSGGISIEDFLKLDLNVLFG